MRTTSDKAEMLLDAARRAAKARDKVHLTYQVSNRLAAIELHARTDGESAYADPSVGREPIVAIGNWNEIDTYGRLTQTRVEISDIPVRLGRAFARLGIPCEWSDEWTTCGECGRLVRTQADSMSWVPYHVYHDGEITCHACVDATQIPGTTKADLLDAMASLGACEQATAWVTEQHTTDAREIVRTCPDPSWIVWFAEQRPMPSDAPAWMRDIYARYAEIDE